MAKGSTPPPAQTTISRDDLERRLQALQDGVRGQVDDKKGTFMTAGGIGAVLIIVVIFLLGTARREEEDDVRRDPPGVTQVAGPRIPLIPGPSMVIVRRAMTEGLFGRSRMWKAVAFAIIARRTIRKLMGSDPNTVAIENIKPGETVVMRGVTVRKPRR